MRPIAPYLKKNRLLFWKIILWLILLYAIQHTVRDILQQFFGINNVFTGFAHREASNAIWCGQYCKWTTLPVKIFYIFSSIYLLRKQKFGWLGWMMIIIIIPVLLQYLDLIIK
ncbi:MAG TPA: hypothetical protein VMW04_02495 [Patescibacteria group bacterium]|nr:hypothetical protein [Patescibacteria group bacterium]